MRGICGPRPGEVDLVNESLDASSPVAPFGVSKRAEGDDSGKPCVVGLVAAVEQKDWKAPGRQHGI